MPPPPSVDFVALANADRREADTFLLVVSVFLLSFWGIGCTVLLRSTVVDAGLVRERALRRLPEPPQHDL